jgi:hypothetical protein
VRACEPETDHELAAAASLTDRLHTLSMCVMTPSSMSTTTARACSSSSRCNAGAPGAVTAAHDTTGWRQPGAPAVLLSGIPAGCRGCSTSFTLRLWMLLGVPADTGRLLCV